MHHSSSNNNSSSDSLVHEHLLMRVQHLEETVQLLLSLPSPTRSLSLPYELTSPSASLLDSSRRNSPFSAILASTGLLGPPSPLDSLDSLYTPQQQQQQQQSQQAFADTLFSQLSPSEAAVSPSRAQQPPLPPSTPTASTPTSIMNQQQQQQQQQQQAVHRVRLSDAQLHTLQCRYAQSPHLGSEQAKVLSREIGLSIHKIKVWFQNKRAYDKRKCL